MMLWDSDDKQVQQADISIWTGQKWKASGALRKAEEHLQHVDIVGTVNQESLGRITREAGRMQRQRSQEAWCRRGRFQASQDQLDPVGQCMRKISELEGYLEYGGASDKVSALFHLRRPTNNNKPPKVETNRESMLFALRETSQPVTHFVVLTTKPDRQEIQMAA